MSYVISASGQKTALDPRLYVQESDLEHVKGYRVGMRVETPLGGPGAVMRITRDGYLGVAHDDQGADLRFYGQNRNRLGQGLLYWNPLLCTKET